MTQGVGSGRRLAPCDGRVKSWRRSPPPLPLARRLAHVALEGAPESDFGLVSDLRRRLCDAGALFVEPAGGDLHSPACEVGDGRHTDVIGKTRGKNAT